MERDDFEDAPRPTDAAPAPAEFVVDIDGFEGPIDVLLALAREQKVDLKQISILQLADQYLAFVAAARRANLELAADYLVMAAWLAYLKSRLLLPEQGGEEEPTGEEMAAALAFHLQRLEAMREAGARLMARPKLGQDFFARGAPERFAAIESTVIQVSLYDLLRAYADQRRRKSSEVLHIEPFEIFTVEDALQRLRGMLGDIPDWASLWRFLPVGLVGNLIVRSAVASTFAASLELAREGRVRIRQDNPFGPIFLRAAAASPGVTPFPSKPET
jgi:segregation and condensation protein A